MKARNVKQGDNLHYPNSAAFRPGDVNPYVTAVVHFYWPYLVEFYDVAYRMDMYSLKVATIHIKYVLEHVNSAYYVHSRNLTLSILGNGGSHYTLYNGVLYKEGIDKHTCEDMLYDLKRIYDQVNLAGTLCSTSVLRPTGHEIMRATQLLTLSREFKFREIKGLERP